MVLTATASPEEQRELEKKLNLRKATYIARNPDRHNIMYRKIERPPSSETLQHLDEIMLPIAHDLMNRKTFYPITIVYSDTSVIGYCYWLFEKTLGKMQYEGEEHPENRLFAQYHAEYTEDMKSHIVKELGNENCLVRVIFATVALGMGLNAKHIRHVIHYKPPTSISKYFQETWRAGRDGHPSTALLYYNATDIRSNRPGIRKDIIKYCKNTSQCYRQEMLNRFGYDSTVSNKNICCGYCADQ
jgi:superfamily II DNA helicase RecQ